MRKYKVTVKYECEVDYDVMAQSKIVAEENILRQNISHATYKDYRTFNRKIIKQKDRTPAEF